jgi:site-specific recombinase XerD
MRTNILIVLDTRRPKPDGTYPLLLRIIHGKTSSQISLGKFFHEKDWDAKERKVKSSYKGTESVTRLNNWISKKKSDALDQITKLEEKKILQTLSTAQQIKENIERNAEYVSFFDYMQKLIDQMTEAGRIGNARSYKSVLSMLKTFCGERALFFTDLNYAFLLKLEASHQKKGNSPNGLAVYMRTIKAVYNQAIKDGLVERELYPFANYQIKTQKTQKRAISVDSINKIEKLSLAPKHPLYHTRNTFLFCFYMRGLPYADMARLKPSNIVDGRIFYQRQKTDKPYNVKITREIQSILQVYLKGKEKDDYVFDIIKRSTQAEIYRDIEWARNRYNKKLKDLGELCGIHENLTTYVARHSFATIAKNLNVPITTISDMLGHESTKTTEIYLDSLPSDLMDAFHQKIIKGKKT